MSVASSALALWLVATATAQGTPDEVPVTQPRAAAEYFGGLGCSLGGGAIGGIGGALAGGAIMAPTVDPRAPLSMTGVFVGMAVGGGVGLATGSTLATAGCLTAYHRKRHVEPPRFGLLLGGAALGTLAMPVAAISGVVLGPGALVVIASCPVAGAMIAARGRRTSRRELTWTPMRTEHGGGARVAVRW